MEELRRGSLTEQFLMVKRKDGSRVKRGPYPLLTRKHGRVPCVVVFSPGDLKTFGPLARRSPPFYLVHPDWRCA